MYTIFSSYNHIKQSLVKIYDEQEASAIAHEVMEYITGLTKLERLTKKENALNRKQEQQLEQAMEQLLTGKPVQYVIEKAWFLGQQYYVSEAVLIPRPETEELVLLIENEWKGKEQISILDIGTGSGCIPIALKKLIPQAIITSCDISDAALQVANKNADLLGVSVNFIQLDILNSTEQLNQYDIIVSNPPYIPTSYRYEMDNNVKDHEPEIALFVPDDDPLLFYKKIAALGNTNLKPNGIIYCELHADHAQETRSMFIKKGYTDTTIKDDIYGKPRMLRATI